MLIGRAILRYRVAPFSHMGLFRIFRPRVASRMHICMRISPGREKARRNKKKIINKRKRDAGESRRQSLSPMNIYLGQTQTLFKVAFDASLGTRQRGLTLCPF